MQCLFGINHLQEERSTTITTLVEEEDRISCDYPQTEEGPQGHKSQHIQYSPMSSKNRSKKEEEARRRQHRSNAWINAIKNAGRVIATARDEETLANSSGVMLHLELLRTYLEKRRQHWYQVPNKMPPPSSPSPSSSTNNNNAASTNGNDPNSNNYYVMDPEGGDTIINTGPMIVTPSLTPSSVITANRFAAFEQDDDDDEEDANLSSSQHEEEGQEEKENVMKEGTILMTMRRLLIRVLTTQSELHAKLTSLREQKQQKGRKQQPRQQQQRHNNNKDNPASWQDAANDYAIAFDCLNKALDIADEEYTRLFHHITSLKEENDSDGINNQNQEEQQQVVVSQLLLTQLADDAQVVMIQLEHFANARDHYMEVAKRRRDYLEQKLRPQWESRDEVKARVGQDRWENNPHPKQDYARQRVADEKELRSVKETMDRLHAMNTTETYSHSKTIYQTAMSRGQQQQQQQDHRTTTTSASDSKRYNGIRPSTDHYKARVSLKDYPDPTMYGWIFSGSSLDSFVEFFEKEFSMEQQNNTTAVDVIVKLDLYYTTATVKTSMDHPSKGKTQLFGKKVTPSEYLQILENPRAHTNVRYQTKQGKKNLGGRGGQGRGGGRGRGREKDRKK